MFKTEMTVHEGGISANDAIEHWRITSTRHDRDAQAVGGALKDGCLGAGVLPGTPLQRRVSFGARVDAGLQRPPRRARALVPGTT